MQGGLVVFRSGTGIRGEKRQGIIINLTGCFALPGELYTTQQR